MMTEEGNARTSVSLMRQFYVSPAASHRIRGGARGREEVMRGARVVATRTAAHPREAKLETEVAGINLRGANE